MNPKSDRGGITDEMLPHIRNTVPNALKLPKRHNKDDSARFMLPLLKGQLFSMKITDLSDSDCEY